MTSFRDDSSTDDKDQELASLFSMWSLSNVLDSKGDSEDSTHGGTGGCLALPLPGVTSRTRGRST